MMYLLLSAALWLAAAQDKRGFGNWMKPTTDGKKPMKELDCDSEMIAKMPMKPCKCIEEEDMCKAPMCAWTDDGCSRGSGMPGKPDKPDMPDKPDRPGRPDKPDMPDKPDKPGRPDMPDKPDKPDMPGKPDKPDRPDKPGKPGRPDGKPTKGCSVMRKSKCRKSKKCEVVDNQCTEKADGGKPDKCMKYKSSKRKCKKKGCLYKAAKGKEAICVSDGGDKPDKPDKPDMPDLKCDKSLVCGEALSCFMGMLFPTTCGPRNCNKPIKMSCPDDMEDMADQLTEEMRETIKKLMGMMKGDKGDKMKDMGDKIKDMGDKVKDMGDKIMDKVKDKVKNRGGRGKNKDD